MRQTAHHYLIFGTVAGFCGIAWNDVGITRFQLPTRTAEAAERALVRRAPGARCGTPTPEVAKAIAAVKRYFEGEETDFAGFTLDLGEQDPFFERTYSELPSDHTRIIGNVRHPSFAEERNLRGSASLRVLRRQGAAKHKRR